MTGTEGSAPAAPARLRQAPGILACNVRDELLVYVPHGNTVVALNSSASAIFDLYQESRSPSEIAETLGDRFGLPGAALLPDVEQAVGKLAAFGLLAPADS